MKSMGSSSESSKSRPRPLSPHLQVYRPQITSVLSITHRATGVFNWLGFFVVTFWLTSVAGGEENYAKFLELVNHPIITGIMFFWSYSIFYHLCNGIRHLFWDIGKGFELDNVTKSGIVVIVVSVIMTISLWSAVL